MSDELIRVPAFLAEETGDYGIMPMCDFCAEVACESADMECGQACGQSCGSQCTVAECKQSCSQGCSQGCDTCQNGCQSGQQSSGAKLEFGTVTATSIQVRIVGLNTLSWDNYGTSKVPRYNSFKISCIGDVRTAEKGSVSGTSKYITYAGLTPGTLYEFNYIVNFTSDTGVTNDYSGGYAEQETNARSKVERWTWTASNGSASTAQTKAAYSAVTGHGSTTDFSYRVWNDLVNKVNEAAVAAGGSWSVPGSKYLSLEETLMSANDKVLTAKRFNSLKVNIGSHVSTGIQDVSPGDTVLGSYFITLADKLNQWIDSI